MKNYQIFFLLHTAVCTFVKSYATALLLLFLCFKLVSAQQAVTIEQINSELDQAAQFAYTARPEKAIPILEKAEAESESMNYSFGVSRAGYTLAIIYFNSSDYNKVINLDEKYLRIGKEAKDHENVSHIHRLKGGAYSELGLLSKGRDEYDEALKYANKMSAGNNKQYALSLIYSNLSSHLLKSAAPQEAIFSSIHQCIAAAEKIDENDDVNISRKYRMIAYAYIIMANEYDKAEDFDLAEDYYLKSLQIQQSHSVPLVEKVVLYNQLGYFYYDRMDFVQSISFAEEGLSIEKKASIPQLRKELFEILSKSYLELDEIEKSKNYFRLFTALNDSLLTSNRVTIDGALYKTISEQKKLSLNNSNKQIIIYTLITLVLLIFGISFFLYQKKQIQIKKIEKVVAQLKEKQKKPNIRLKTTRNVNNEEVEKNSLMPEEAEKRLLEKLQEFENKLLFLERKVSLPYVAAEIETNTKYLSYIIRKHKAKDFNEYINELRINYIVQKINDDPVYRKYKINTLAEEAGFSSHSKFTTVFKSTLGVSPSEFLKYFQQK